MNDFTAGGRGLGTQCSSCGGAECEQGCEFGDGGAGPPAIWKAALAPGAEVMYAPSCIFR